ncbi:DUF1624 domain-containing protein [Candidatus Shapirobacteria bacterium]|nr:DUF1624 domain-containing protein [Candidatus Shapirobacteria bacterium]
MNNERYWQIDALRGVAIAGMVIYHFLVDLEMIFQVPIGVYKFPVVILARITAILFIALAGISASVKFERIRSVGSRAVWLSYGKRALEILFWAGIVSAVTYIMFPGETVVMGILHFLGLSTLLIVPLLYIKNNLWIGIMALVTFVLAIFIPNIVATHYWLIPLGIVPKTFGSLDYFPLIPWFGVMLLGVIIGKSLSKKLELNVGAVSGMCKLLTMIGQKSLLVYLVHQPILWGVMTLITILR